MPAYQGFSTKSLEPASIYSFMLQTSPGNRLYMQQVNRPPLSAATLRPMDFCNPHIDAANTNLPQKPTHHDFPVFAPTLVKGFLFLSPQIPSLRLTLTRDLP